MDTSPYMTRSSTVDKTAARPGMRVLSTVSSLTENAVSQPQ